MGEYARALKTGVTSLHSELSNTARWRTGWSLCLVRYSAPLLQAPHTPPSGMSGFFIGRQGVSRMAKPLPVTPSRLLALTQKLRGRLNTMLSKHDASSSLRNPGQTMETNPKPPELTLEQGCQLPQCSSIFRLRKSALLASWSIPSTPSSILIQLSSNPTLFNSEKIAS